MQARIKHLESQHNIADKLSNELTWTYGSSSEDNGKSFYLQADFTPTVGGASGEPRNEPLRSPSNVTLNVLPELFVATGPSTSAVAINVIQHLIV